MVTALIRHTAKWTAPSPFWTADPQAGTSKENGSPWQPAILRFDNDLFMEETLSLLAYHPEGLTERIARPETWMKPMKPPVTISRNEAVEPISEFSKKIRQQDARNSLPAVAAARTDEAKDSTGAEDDDEELPFKLYQPAHQRFYLVAASLVCQQAGMPDRRIDAGKREAAGFVIRRVSYKDLNAESNNEYKATDDLWSEYAFTATAEGFAWKRIPLDKREQIQGGEERLPLFAMHFNDVQGHRRRMLAGLIPVGRREEYLNAPASSDGSQETEGTEGEQQTSFDPRRLLFEAKVIAPWTALIQQAATIKSSLIHSHNAGFASRFGTEEDPEELKKIIKSSRDQIQTISWYTLYDLARYLDKYLNPVWQVITEKSQKGSLANEHQLNLYEALEKITLKYDQIYAYPWVKETATPGSDVTASFYYGTKGKKTLFDALKAIYSLEKLEKNTIDFDSSKNSDDWPDFFFPLTDPSLSDFKEGPLPDSAGEESDLTDWEAAIARLDTIPPLVEKALEPTSDPLPDLQSPQQALSAGDGWFVIRCVYERPDCGPLNPAALSAPTEKFLMAPFFDPQAPARPVRISLPMDISPAGLRKFKKNATLIMSDMLCGKVKEIRKLTFADLVLSVLPWPFHKDLPEPTKPGPCSAKDREARMYCSLSIPIVTLVALILMMIIVALFDTFFRWIPYLFTCFPVPGMKGKKA